MLAVKKRFNVPPNLLDSQQFDTGLLGYLAQSPTPFHAVSSLRSLLEKQDFCEVLERDAWSLQPGGRYYCCRNDSSLIAWVMPEQASLVNNGLRMVGAHTDSPCLKVKPHPEMKEAGMYQLGVEVYGGALLNPWFDRDLSLAGRVQYLDVSGELKNALVDFVAPVALIPSLAIHLDREANKNRSINAQQHLPVILSHVAGDDEAPCFRTLLNDRLQEQGVDAREVIDYEISLYDTQPPAIVGLKQEFIASARLDNLLSCYIGLQALLEVDDRCGAMLVCNDHEEVGSVSTSGAAGGFLSSVLTRIMPDPEARSRMLASSCFISADNAHAVHPNYQDKHDANHGPALNQGPVIKVNSNQRYATSSATSAMFRQWAKAVDVPVQSFVVRSDMGCGSTIGPVTAAKLGVPTLDIGVPTYAMHSIRELAGRQDAYGLYRVLSYFMNQERL